MMNKSKLPEKLRRTTSVKIQRKNDIAEAIETAGKLAAKLGMGKINQYKVATAVSELATNIHRYAGHGIIYMGIIKTGGRQGIEIIAEDHGPGIADLASALMDNFSTSGSLGVGLPGAKRLMDEFTIESKPGSGTKVVVRKWV